MYISIKEAKSMCDDNYSYFISNIDELCEKYENKFLAIKNADVIGVYNSFDEAYNKTIKTEELGTFLIQLCSKDNDNIVNYFYSNNVVFA